MKKTLLFGLMLASIPFAKFGYAPANWGDFRFGLVNDNNSIHNQRMLQAVNEGVKIAYRYRYINGGLDSTKNAMSWSFNTWTDYCADSPELAGTKTSLVIYMLQEEQGNAMTKANANDANQVKKYLANIKSVATKCKDQQSVYVIEPDTWGYLMQLGTATDKTDPCSIPAKVNNLGAGWEYLSDLPNNLCGLAQATIRTVHRFDPSSYAGVLASHWGYQEQPGWHANGLFYTDDAYIQKSAAANVAWFSKLLGNGADRGDFIGVEKNGYSAGHYKANGGITYWYWDDAAMKKYTNWSKALGQGLDLPVMGWQISIGHMGLPNRAYDGTNTNNAYEDTFFPYFFAHTKEFMDAGFIGFLVGKGLADDTDFSNESEGASKGDGGWFFSQLKQFDKGRPYINQWGQAAAKDHYIPLQGRILSQNFKTLEIAMPSNAAGTYNIRDLGGKIVHQFEVKSDKVTLDLSKISAGQYLIEGDRTWLRLTLP